MHKLFASIDEIMNAVPSNEESAFYFEQVQKWQNAIKEYAYDI